MIEDKAKQAAIARQNLAEKLIVCADALKQVAEVMTLVSIEVAQAIEQENVATQGYITSLEAKLSQQRELS